jgi:hypothetical protein
LKSRHLADGYRYPRSVQRSGDCILTAAKLKHTAAQHANAKSDIHMARFPLSALTSPDPLSSGQ